MDFVKKIIVFIFFIMLSVVCISDRCFSATYNDAISGKVSEDKIHDVKQTIDTRRSNTQKKIKELKLKETREINKLYKSQGSLEVTKKELQITTQNLENTKLKLFKLQNSLDVANEKYQHDQEIVAKRIREIYKGERISFLNVIFLSEDINTFLDKFYYQQLIAKKDTEQLTKLQEQIKTLSDYTRQIEEQKQSVLYSMARIESKKNKIAQDIYTSQYLIKKLQTDRRTYEQAEKELARQSSNLTKMLRTNQKTAPKFATTSDFVRPLAGPITSPFGWRTHPIFKSRKFHSGVDIGAGMGTPIKCANSGVVVYSGWYGGYGKVVIVDHGSYKGKPTSTLYAHMSSYSVNKGAKVTKGQVIGRVGTTGYSTGPHLHFEVRVNGNPTNPMNYVR